MTTATRRPTARIDAYGRRRTPTKRREWRRAQWRWRFADLLDRSRRTCWADLVHWAMRDDYDREHGERGISTVFGAKGCKTGPDYQRDECCYCGKFRNRERWP